MPYEIFAKKTPRMGNPVMSFSKLGQIAFNQTATRILQKAEIEDILLMWDSVEGKLAIKSTTNKKDPRAYRLRYNDKSNGATFSAKTFLDYYGIDYADRRPIPIDINPNSEMFLEVKLPEECLKLKKAQPRLVEKGTG